MQSEANDRYYTCGKSRGNLIFRLIHNSSMIGPIKCVSPNSASSGGKAEVINARVFGKSVPLSSCVESTMNSRKTVLHDEDTSPRMDDQRLLVESNGVTFGKFSDDEDHEEDRKPVIDGFDYHKVHSGHENSRVHKQVPLEQRIVRPNESLAGRDTHYWLANSVSNRSSLLIDNQKITMQIKYPAI